MKQTIIVSVPPVYDRCDKMFGVRGKPVLFAWGNIIYNPENVAIPRELLAHEAVHGERQGKYVHQVEAWWELYLDSPQFRYSEELVAHRAEFRAYVRAHPGKNCAHQLDLIADRLASELYGKLVTPTAARAAILGNA